MVNFDLLNSQGKQPTVVEPRRLFQTLKRDGSYEYLRAVQVDVLDEWYERRNERDLVIKMNTGSGKTLVGLLLLWSRLKEGKGPALYLCANNHLASQVRREADALGISHVDFEAGNRFPSEFRDSSSILITNAHKLFNGLSVFGIANRLSAEKVGSLLIDDAHTCISIAREQFTVTFARESLVGSRIFSFFESSLRGQSVGIYADVERGRGDAFIQVPFWSWQERLEDVAKLLSANSDSEELRFVWPFLKTGEVLANSSAVISGDTVEIAPRLIPIELVPSFDNARHRVYMSATLVDDAGLIRHFAADSDSVRKPIHPKVGGDIGERLIISPPLVDWRLEETSTIDLVEEIRSTHQVNVVVLAPSWYQASKWKTESSIGGRGADIGQTVEQLSSSDSNLAVFANRYDGIDLPNATCRVLLVDNLPHEHQLVNLSEGSARRESPFLRQQIAQRIEQGIGRGVRSRADYCVVLLIGKDLVSFITEVENQSFFTEETKQQIELGKKLTGLLKRQVASNNQTTNSYKAILDLVGQCLKRDPGWLEYHGKALQGSGGERSIDPISLKLADIELQAWRYASSSQYERAAEEIGRIFSEANDLTDEDIGWYLQVQAQYLNQIDKNAAQEKQLKAHELNRNLLRPLSGITYRKLQKKRTNQAYGVLDWVKKSNDPNALVSRANLVLENLAFGIDHESFEQAFHDLATIVGFHPQRPDKEDGVGPDILWCMENDQYLIVEAKNQVDLSRKEIYKSEAEQLGHHIIWFKQNYMGESYTPILIHPSAKLARDAYIEEDTRILQYRDMQRIVESVRTFVVALASKRSDQWTVQEIAGLLQTYQLRSNDFLKILLSKRANQALSGSIRK